MYGKLSDDEINENSHQLIVDFFFCNLCEKRFSVIESEYAKTLDVIGSEIYDSGILSELGVLFWSSILWRMSINEKSGVRLTKNHQETLRHILNRSLKLRIDDIDIENICNSKDLKKISYKLFRSCEIGEDEPTLLMFHPKFRYPHTLVIDEYILLFSFNGNYNEFLEKGLHGLKDEAFSAPINNRNSNEHIQPISSDKLKKLIEVLIGDMSRVRINRIDKYLNKLHIALGGKDKTMYPQLRNEIFEEITSNEKKLGRMYTKEDLINSVKTVFIKNNLVSD